MPRVTADYIPSYRHHKHSGQAIVTLSYRDHLLGPFGTPESKVRYHELIARWLKGGREPLDPLPLVGEATRAQSQTVTVQVVADAFLQHAGSYYAAPGKRSNTTATFRFLLKDLCELYGTLEAEAFTPSRLKALRELWIRRGYVRTSINRYTTLIRQVFRWATSEEFVLPTIVQALECVPPLKSGRSAAKESDPVRPVPDADVDAIRPHVSQAVWGMIQLQRLTGARGGELFGLRACDIDMSKEVWTFSPPQHKTAHHGKIRQLCFGPQCQEVLRPFLTNGPIDQPLFKPRDSNAERKRLGAAGHRRAGQPPTRRKTHRIVRMQYDDASYRRAVVRACEKAGVTQWHPHQLRHSFATKIRKQFGLEVSRAAIGHSTIRTTELYAEQDLEQARLVAARLG